MSAGLLEGPHTADLVVDVCPDSCPCWDLLGYPCGVTLVGSAPVPVGSEPSVSEPGSSGSSGSEPDAGVGWSVPGVSWDCEPGPQRLPGVSAVLAGLAAAVDAVSGVDPAVLPDGQVLVDAEALQASVQRLRVTQLGWTEQVQARRLHELRGLRSMSGWLEVHAPDAVRADRTLASRLGDLPVLAEAVGSGRVGLAAAAQVGKAVAKVRPYLDRPDGLVDGQPGEPLVGAVLGNTVDLVCQAKGGLAQDAPLLAEVTAAVAALAAQGGSMLARVSGAFTLLAQHLGAGEALTGALAQQVDAVLPNLLEQQQAKAEERRGLSLTPKRDGAWRVEGDLTPEVGEQLFAALAAEARRDPGNPVDTQARAQARDQAVREQGEDPFTDGPRWEDLPQWEREALRDLVGRPGAEHPEHAADLAARLGLDGPPPATETRPETQTRAEGLTQAEELALLVPRTPSRRLHDAFGRLLTRYLAAGLGGVQDKHPVQLAVTVSDALVEGRPGALPAKSARTGRSLARSLVRRWWGDAQVTALLLSRGWLPLGVVHSERTLTARERQALGVQWDNRCAGTDCCPPTPDPLRPLIPHHVQAYASNGGRTSLGETIPCCERLHADLHVGKRTIRLRDGRLLTEDGFLEDA